LDDHTVTIGFNASNNSPPRRMAPPTAVRCVI
jgi:hypothetical protein